MKRNKFLMIYEDLKNNILSQDLNYGDQLPSEHDLVVTYNASRETVRKALNLLERDGMIQKMRGKGSIVIFQEITEFPFTDLISFKEIKERLGLNYQTEVIVNEVVEARQYPNVQRELKVAEREELIHIQRTRRINNQVKIFDEDFFLKTVVDDISDDIAKDSIYAYLEKDLNLNISYSSKSITFEPFSSIEYKIFGNQLTPYTATVRSHVYLKDTTCFQYNISKHIATDFKFKEFSRRR